MNATNTDTPSEPKKGLQINQSTLSTTLLIALILGGFGFYQSSSRSWAIQGQVNERVDVTFAQISITLEALNGKLESGTTDRYTAEVAKKDNQILELKMERSIQDLKIEFLTNNIEVKK